MDGDEALDEMESLFSEGYNTKDFRKYGKLTKTIMKSPGAVTTEQHSRIFGIAMNLFRRGIHKFEFFSTIEHFSNLLFKTGYRTTDWLEHANYADPRSRDLLDYAMVFLSEGRIRDGVVLLTQNRLFVVGKEKVRDIANLILYPELEEHEYSGSIMEEYAYYGCMDHIDLEGEDEVELSGSVTGPHIDVLKKNLRYLQTRPRYLYGPLFFRYRLSDKVKIETGDLVIRICLENFKDKERLKERYAQLLEGIQRVIASAESQQGE